MICGICNSSGAVNVLFPHEFSVKSSYFPCNSISTTKIYHLFIFYQGLSDINKNNQISSPGIFQLKLTTMAAKTCLKPINKPHTAIMKSS